MHSTKHKNEISDENRVLPKDFSYSINFFNSDLILQHYLKVNLSKNAQRHLAPLLEILGKQAAQEIDQFSMVADKQTPTLLKRDRFGENINEIDFHPAYFNMMDMAIQSQMFSLKWNPKQRKKFQKERHLMGFSLGHIFTMSEAGLYCPLCMTDGVARIIDRYASDEDKIRLLPSIYSLDLAHFFTGAMFLTEKAGGSDVGANMVKATKVSDTDYLLNGEKWFCSNVNADLILALARTDHTIRGTKGLSIFLIEKEKLKEAGESLNIIRLKDKIGVRSMASAEVLLQNTPAKIIGQEGQGFYIMADMINLSRIYNSVTAVGIARRALIEAYQYLSHRITFGKKTIEHAMVREKLSELASLYQANFYLSMRAIEALDLADNGDPEEQELLRVLTPMLKKATAETAVYMCREAMEAIGGIAYIEESVIPKLLRDALVLPIWEGAGNIMTLDMIRASSKSNGLKYIFKEINLYISKDDHLKHASKQLEDTFNVLFKQDREIIESSANDLFERLTNLYQIALLIKNKDENSKVWINKSIEIKTSQILNTIADIKQSPNVEQINTLMGWKI